MDTAVCRMKESLGEIQPCPGAPCAFWEGEGCALGQIDFRGRPDVATFLLSLRSELESVRIAEDARLVSADSESSLPEPESPVLRAV